MRSLDGTLDLTTHPRTLRRRRPTWSVRSLTVLAIFVIVATAVPIFVLGHQSLLVRAEWVTVIVAALLWLLLFVGLYRGARVRKDEPLPEFNGTYDASDIGLDGIGDLGHIAGGVDDFIGGVIALVLWLVLGLALIFLLPMLLTGLAYVIVLLVAALMWIFRRALRQVFARSLRCRGRVGRSMYYASGYTTLYAGWLIAILTLADLYRH